MWRNNLAAATFLAPLVALTAAAAGAAEPTPIGQASLIADRPAVAEGESFRVALRLTLPAGWHVYWRNPGEAGVATDVAWTLPPGFTAGPIEWPTPRRFATGPVVSYGHAGDVWLLSTVTAGGAIAAGSPATLRADAEWLACADICVPEAAHLVLALPMAATPSATAAAATPLAAAFAEAERRLPRRPPWPVAAIADGERLHLDFALPSDLAAVSDAWFFPERFGVVEAGRPQPMTVAGDRRRLTLFRSTAVTAWPPTLVGVLSLTAAAMPVGHAIDIPIRAAPAGDPPTATTGNRP